MQHYLHARLERPLVRLGLANEVAQGLLADDRVDRRAHRVLRPADGGVGDREQQPLLAAHTAQVIEHLGFDAVLGARVDLLHDADEQLGQRVGDLTDPGPAQARQQRQTHLPRMRAQPRRMLRRRTSAPRRNTRLRSVGEQVDGQIKRADALELRNLRQQRLQAQAAGVSLQLRQQPLPTILAVTGGVRGDESLQALSDRDGWDLAGITRKPRLELEELQQQRKPQSRRTRLVRQQHAIALDQRPAGDQLLRLPLTPHEPARCRYSPPAATAQ